MQTSIFSRILKWLMFFLLLIASGLLGVHIAHSCLPTPATLQSTSGKMLHWIENHTATNLNDLQRQLALAGIHYLMPEKADASLAHWLRQLPQRLLVSQAQVLAASSPEEVLLFAAEKQQAADLTENFPSEDASAVDISSFLTHHAQNNAASSVVAQSPDNKKIVLYCTHNSESYTPSSGDTHIAGGHGLINQVAEHFSATLNQKGLPCEFVFALHDWPSYDNSYTESRKTVQQILEQNPEQLLALFDVHRDSIASATQADTVMVNGKKSARILLVVGTNQRKPHPNWEQNLALAQEIEAIGQELYPGLIRGIEKKAGTYHQEFFTGALLLEFGTDLNTVEEAEYASELFADILSRLWTEK